MWVSIVIGSLGEYKLVDIFICLSTNGDLFEQMDLFIIIAFDQKWNYDKKMHPYYEQVN